jgi:carbonic anhydrase
MNWNVKSPIPHLQVNGTRFSFLQFHLHQPAEHTLNGRFFPLELHFVYEDESGNPFALAFVAKLSHRKTSSFFSNLVKHRSLRIPDIQSYWVYTGSLTTKPLPSPTSVNWLVNKKYLRISRKDLRRLLARSKESRELQNRAGRSICFCSSSNIC